MKKHLTILLTEWFIFFLLLSCSVWQSEGRKFLEKEGLEFAAQGATSFRTYKEKKCSPQPTFQAHDLGLIQTGHFQLHIKDSTDPMLEEQWELYTYSGPEPLSQNQQAQANNKSTGFRIHQIYLERTDNSLYCEALTLTQPQLQISKTDIVTLIQETAVSP